MLINGKRALAYTSKVLWVRPIQNADNIEEIGVLGWHLIAKKGEFNEGDICVYFEIDSKLPKVEWADFMTTKKYRVKTMRLSKFGVISQGLALPITIDKRIPNKENVDVTNLLGVTYYVNEDNKRKANIDKYASMKARYKDLLSKAPYKWLMKYKWGRDLLNVFLDKRTNVWCDWVAKTDEERCQNLPLLFNCENKQHWIVTEKIDGTSTTFTLKRKGLGKPKFYVCSRNVVFTKGRTGCYYDINYYTMMAKKYDVENVLRKLMTKDLDFITLQGETFGNNVQKRDYSLALQEFRAFNLIYGYKNGEVKKHNTLEMKAILEPLGIECVPVLDAEFILPETCDEMVEYADGNSVLDGKIREGVVVRTYDCSQSFKAVSTKYLLSKNVE